MSVSGCVDAAYRDDGLSVYVEPLDVFIFAPGRFDSLDGFARHQVAERTVPIIHHHDGLVTIAMKLGGP